MKGLNSEADLFMIMTDWFNLHLLANTFKPTVLSESDLSITCDASHH